MSFISIFIITAFTWRRLNDGMHHGEISLYFCLAFS